MSHSAQVQMLMTLKTHLVLPIASEVKERQRPDVISSDLQPWRTHYLKLIWQYSQYGGFHKILQDITRFLRDIDLPYVTMVLLMAEL